jgi:hypothetical protein
LVGGLGSAGGFNKGDIAALKLMLLTAYSDPGTGKNRPYFALKKRVGKPGGTGLGVV